MKGIGLQVSFAIVQRIEMTSEDEIQYQESLVLIMVICGNGRYT